MERREEEVEPKGSLRKYFILGMFVLLSTSSAFQWIEYSIIAHIIVDFYSVSYAAVDWTSMIYMATYILFVIPASWFLNTYGLRASLLIGSAGNCLGALIKLLSVQPNLFWVTFLGQTVVGSSQVFILGIPPRLAAIWFNADQVSTACAAGVFGNQLGIAIGFLLPSQIVRTAGAVNSTLGSSSTAERDFTAAGLSNLFLISAIANSLIFLCIFFFFSKEPPHSSPMNRIAIRQSSDHCDYFKSLHQLVKDANFVLLFITYGINVGVFYAISTLLNQIVLHYYPDGQKSVGTIGLLIVVAGMFGSVACGIVLDKFHRYKATTFLVYLFSFVGTVLFTTTLCFGDIWLIFVIAAFLGFYMTGYLPIGFEFAAELTFPISEGTTSGLLNLSAQVFGVLIIVTMGQIISSIGFLTCNIILCVLLFLGLLLTVTIKSDLKRQKAQNDFRNKSLTSDIE